MSPISDADLDRLADYTAGVLDQDEHAQVDELVRTDPAWRRAHEVLAAAQPRLDAALAGLADEPIPAHVAARLDAALADAGGVAAGTTNVVPFPRRRWARLAAGTTAAAATVAAIFGGVIALSHSQNAARSASTAGGASVAAPAAGPRDNALSIPPGAVLHSGTDYTRQSLPAAGGAQAESSNNRNPAGPAPAAPGDVAGSAADLQRLDDPQALRECLAAIVAAHGGTPSVVDYARFEGRPALVVVLTSSGGRRIVVAGPQCGVAGTAEVFSTVG